MVRSTYESLLELEVTLEEFEEARCGVVVGYPHIDGIQLFRGDLFVYTPQGEFPVSEQMGFGDFQASMPQDGYQKKRMKFDLYDLELVCVDGQAVWSRGDKEGFVGEGKHVEVYVRQKGEEYDTTLASKTVPGLMVSDVEQFQSKAL